MVRDMMDMGIMVAKSAPVSGSPNELMSLMFYLILFVLIAIPLASIILSVLLWKRVRYSRGLTTLFVMFVWLAVFLFLLMVKVPLVLLLAPTIFAVGIVYLLWFDKNTAMYFGSSLDLCRGMTLMKDDFSKMPGKVKIVLLLFFLPALLLFFVGIAILMLLAVVGMLEANIVLLPVILLFVLLGLIIPYLIWKRNKWGRYLGIVVSFIDLFGFPIGTALGIASLYLLFHPEVKEYFER